MRAPSVCRGTHLGFWVTVLLLVRFCYYCTADNSFQVLGVGECVDCKKNNIKSSHAFSGLRVAIECKDANGQLKTRGAGELDKQGKFTVKIPREIVKDDGELKEECFAQLHSASNAPCPTHNGLESSKIILQSNKENGKHKFGPAGKLAFSPITCTSAFLWPHFNYPPLPKLLPFPTTHPWFNHPWYKPLPKMHFPPLVFPPLPPKYFHPPIYKKPFPPPVPVYEKPLPPPAPVYEKPLPPPVHVEPPPVPVYVKPLPPPVPVYAKPLPPPVPIYKPPSTPTYKKPCPPIIPHLPPLPKFPPIPKLPPIYKKPLPHFPKFPPKSYHHPKFGYWPPHPPYSSHP
ncbi:PREDICTED: proline-rich protein 4-like isoform X3 [Nelumbo nucifera]|uniref:Proline-rich protein 4-like isoform X3 n=1 Tax=Nelumbo nucifera TaxID=4432 RepID=A0A1U8Q9D6_NELNU|nr:PREDICTED: proline-rich protein 4-like isoform X3 [Nelumbo nucifera]